MGFAFGFLSCGSGCLRGVFSGPADFLASVLGLPGESLTFPWNCLAFPKAIPALRAYLLRLLAAERVDYPFSFHALIVARAAMDEVIADSGLIKVSAGGSPATSGVPAPGSRRKGDFPRTPPILVLDATLSRSPSGRPDLVWLAGWEDLDACRPQT